MCRTAQTHLGHPDSFAGCVRLAAPSAQVDVSTQRILMANTTHSARITGPVHYLGEGGRESLIPLGPCLVEQLDGRSVDIFWGDRGDETAALSFEAIQVAEDCGNLVVLD